MVSLKVELVSFSAESTLLESCGRECGFAYLHQMVLAPVLRLQYSLVNAKAFSTTPYVPLKHINCETPSARKVANLVESCRSHNG